MWLNLFGLLPSLLFFSLIFTLTGLCRRLARHYLPLLPPSAGRHIAYTCLLDFLSTLELCCCSIERATLYGKQPLPVYLGVWFLLCLLQPWASRGGGTCNPCTLVQRLGTHSISTAHAAARLAAQLVAGNVAYRGSRAIWRIGISEDHRQRSLHTLCKTSLYTTTLLGMVMECLAIMAFLVIVRESGRRYGKYVDYIASAAAIIITLSGIAYTGMFFNPVLATSLTYGCEGTDLTSHMIVYWLGPCLGTILTMKLYTDI